jgi:hypothetical protein
MYRVFREPFEVHTINAAVAKWLYSTDKHVASKSAMSKTCSLTTVYLLSVWPSIRSSTLSRVADCRNLGAMVFAWCSQGVRMVCKWC